MPCPFTSLMSRPEMLLLQMLTFCLVMMYVKSYTINRNGRSSSVLEQVRTKFGTKTIPAKKNIDAKVKTVVDSNRDTSLPWAESINPTRECVYMPMFQAQLDRIQAMGGEFQRVPLQEEIAFRSSATKPARIGNLCFRSEKFRKVRMTYFDAGDSVQVFNTLWYPSFEYDLPLLGVDLISLGKNRVLSVVDFQPLHPTTDYHNKYIDQLTPIRNKYKDLQGVLSGKIYDDTSFFSKNMLFGRFSDESKLKNTVAPAFEEYLDAYLGLMDKAVPDHSESSKEIVQERQRAYDIYSAKKDPAVGLFDAYFGKEWSNDFVDNYLFSLSDNVHSKQRVHNFDIDKNGQVNVKGSAHNPHSHKTAPAA